MQVNTTEKCVIRLRPTKRRITRSLFNAESSYFTRTSTPIESTVISCTSRAVAGLNISQLNLKESRSLRVELEEHISKLMKEVEMEARSNDGNIYVVVAVMWITAGIIFG